jgi:serine/threonine protein kinase
VLRREELSTTLKSTISLGRWNGTQVVVKSSLGNDFDFTEELLHEIEVLSSLRHPDLVMFLGACLEPDQPIMCITEYLSGGDLERYYMKMQRQHETVWHPGLQQVLQWSSAVARALAFLHNRRVPILHRDLQLG